VPVAAFTASPNPQTEGGGIQFLDKSSGIPTSWQWDFDNDSTIDSTLKTPIHVYPASGVYTVTLTVSNSLGTDSLTKTDFITILPKTDINVDANRDGAIDDTDDASEELWSQTVGAVYYFNIDDDNSNTNEDYKEATKTAADANDLARMIVKGQSTLPAGAVVAIKLSTSAQGKVYVYQLSGSTWTRVYTAGTEFGVPLADILAGDVTLGVEGRAKLGSGWDGYVDFTLEIRDSAAALLGSDMVRMRQAPPLFATNLWQPTEVQVVTVTGGSTQNSAFVGALSTICAAGGFTLTQVPGASYFNDRWIQDSHEPAVIQLPAPGGRRVIDETYQAHRDREIDVWVKPGLIGPDAGVQVWFGAVNTSLNYGGNIEVVPPYNGRAWGRVIVGGGNGPFIGTTTPATDYMDTENRQYFDANAVQGPHIQVTTEWLAVGHVDEYTMFIPAPNTARGYVCLIASPMRAWNQLVALNGTGGGALQVFAGRSGWQTTVSAIVGNAALGTLQGQVQTRIDQGRDEIKAATGLTDADFIELPVMFEHVGASLWLAAYNPGVVNLVCLPAANGTTYLAIPDPEGPDPGTGDIWQLDIQAQLASLDTAANPYDITFVDVFFSYHDLLGEAHCGTNTVRTPPNEDWWDK
jgi:protein-arginine deiminase